MQYLGTLALEYRSSLHVVTLAACTRYINQYELVHVPSRYMYRATCTCQWGQERGAALLHSKHAILAHVVETS